MNKFSRNLSLSLVFGAAAILSVTSVYAAKPDQTENFGNRPFLQINASDSGSKPGLRKQLAQIKLQGDKLAACQARENIIKKRSENLTRMALNMDEKFASISARVNDYYNTKLVPQNKVVPNYIYLTSDIQLKRATIQTSLQNAQTDLANFSCDQNNPKGVITLFNEDMKKTHQSLKDYRTSIRNLIVAIRSVNGQNQRANQATPSANTQQDDTQDESEGNQ